MVDRQAGVRVGIKKPFGLGRLHQLGRETMEATGYISCVTVSSPCHLTSSETTVPDEGGQ